MNFTKKQTRYRLFTKELSYHLELIEANDTTDQGQSVNPQDLKSTKEELQKLNKQLFEYIEKVRNLEQENIVTENELKQLKQSHIQVDKIFEDEKMRLAAELKEEKRKCEQLQGKNVELEGKTKENTTNLTNTKNQVEEKEKELSELTDKYAKMEATIVSMVEKLKFYDEIIQAISKIKKEQVLKEELVKAYEKETKEVKIKITTIESEMKMLKDIKTELVKSQTEKEMQYNEQKEEYKKTVSEKKKEVETVKTDIKRQISQYRGLTDEKIKLDEEIKEYRTVLDEGETHIKSQKMLNYLVVCYINYI
ncbi:hypothetical protein NL108_001033 [Boleophthalmus pectinirostris]|uniref:low molecular weight neuronal intermediate filament-like n=1 Tax=Boleophthalmus pectinirostris TaxID=150288 RepID=UPI00242D9DC3|nr:low molecular weight neuronal intermediate filament-like [Boleophthalmus pectinirostris]KAJ0064143.1 hypothetical protein NL108_001033 [Boleophthalmus pectinirostris]